MHAKKAPDFSPTGSQETAVENLAGQDTDASSEQAEVDEDANAAKDDEDGDEKVKESKDAGKAPGKWTAWLGRGLSPKLW